MKTVVVYRKFSEGDTIALFPNEQSGKYIDSYQIIGQHGDASPTLIDELEPCTRAEVARLRKELISVGYTDLEEQV